MNTQHLFSLSHNWIKSHKNTVNHMLAYTKDSMNQIGNRLIEGLLLVVFFFFFWKGIHDEGMKSIQVKGERYDDKMQI